MKNIFFKKSFLIIKTVPKMLKHLIFGFILHLIFLASIFEIYFQSPVITGLNPQNDLDGAPAKR